LLAPGLGAGQPEAVERRGAVGEAALRAGGVDDVAGETLGEGVGEAVDGVTFGRGGGLGWAAPAAG
jgi:hypothetical protein